MGFEVADFADFIGMPLLPWQRWLAIHALEVLPDGRPRHRTVLTLVARQSGKTTLLKVLALYWLFVEQVPLVLGTSTKLDYARESWQGAVELAQGCRDLFDELAPGAEGVRRANGEQTLQTVYGSRYKIAAANADAGRSLTVHRLILDELRQHHTWEAWGAATKAMMAVGDAQCWAITNAGEDRSVVLNDLRARALESEQSGSSVALFEWSAPEGCDLDDLEAWAQANPALGYGTVTIEAIAESRSTDPEAVFRTEVLCQSVSSMEAPPIPVDKWLACVDVDSQIATRPVLALDVSLDRSWACIALAGYTIEGIPQVEVAKYDRGTDWVVPELARMRKEHRPYVVGLDPKGPAGSLVYELEQAGVTVTELGLADQVAGCGALQDAVEARQIRHLGDQILEDALKSSAPRDVGDAWAWTRRKSAGDICPLVAATEAVLLLERHGRKPGHRPVVAWL